MPQQTLWPTINPVPPRTMAEMLYDAAVGLGDISQNKLDFYVDAVGVAPDPFGPVTRIRYNCYIRVIKKSYLHLLCLPAAPLKLRSERPRATAIPRSTMRQNFGTRFLRYFNGDARRR
jgi:hypothetical protein